MDTEQLLWLPDPKEILCFQTTFSLFFHIFPKLRICLFFVYVNFGAKGLTKMKKKNDRLPRLILDWCNILVPRCLSQITSNFATIYNDKNKITLGNTLQEFSLLI